MLFGLAVGCVALLLLGVALWRLATGRLHPNRWRRGLTLAIPGLGLGFLLTFSLSALRVVPPHAALWSTLLMVGAAVGFAAGYLSPTPVGDVDEDAESVEYRLEGNDVAPAGDGAPTSSGDARGGDLEEPAGTASEEPSWPPIFRR
jgi:hypothetical protein